MASIIGGVLQPGRSKPPVPSPPPYTPAPVAAPATPTFTQPMKQADPGAAIASQTDPKIQALINQLSHPVVRQPGVGYSDNYPGLTDAPNSGAIADVQKQIGDTQSGLDAASSKFSLDTGKTAAQSEQLNALLAQLMQGKGIDVGPLNADPQAQAFRTAKTREADQAREAEAARLGASGVTGSGDFDARLAQINEAKGADIAGFEADLTGKRRTEMTNTAVTGAGLQLSELDRQRQAAQAEATTSQNTGATKLGSLQALLATLTGADANATASQQALLAQLLGEQGRVQGAQAGQSAQAQSDARAAEQLRMQQEQLRQEMEDRAKMNQGSQIGGIVRR